MNFEIRLGIPEVNDIWRDLCERRKKNKLGKAGIIFHNKLGKVFNLLSTNPRHPSLSSHEILLLSKRYGQKVWQSYLENNTPSAGRVFWVYGPHKNEITIIGIEPHPENSKRGYTKINLSGIP